MKLLPALVAVIMAIVIVSFQADVLAQPPGLPGSPEQAPLGGLAVLAAAGGAYAIKKLRDRRE